MLDPKKCLPGQEQFEEFEPNIHRVGPFKNKSYVQYDYRHTNGNLFSTVALTLEKCREKRDSWLQNQ